MKITRNQLRRLIKEELQLLTEELHPKVVKLINVLGGEDSFKKKMQMDPLQLSKNIEVGGESMEAVVDDLIAVSEKLKADIEKVKQGAITTARQNVEDLEA